MEFQDITVQCEGFVYRKPSAAQIEMAKKRVPWIFEPEKIIDLGKKKED